MNATKLVEYDFEMFEYLPPYCISVVEYDESDLQASAIFMVIFMAVLNTNVNMVRVPLQYKNIKIDAKPRRGRIALAMKTFIKQLNN